MARTMGKNPKFYMGHPTTRFDVHPQAREDEVVAYDGNYFWLKGAYANGKPFWYTSPVGYEFTHEITAEEAGYVAE